MDCGATCLKNIAKYYGKIISISYLRKITYTGRQGTNLKGLSKAAEDLGFRTLAVQLSFEKLRNEVTLPAILYWNNNHFIILYKITNKKVYISDPSLGLINYSHAQFLHHWLSAKNDTSCQEGIALLFETTPSFYEKNTQDEIDEEKLNSKQFLIHYVIPHKKLMLQVMLSLIAGSVLQLFVPFLTQNIVDTGIYKKDMSFIWLVLLAQLMLILGQMGLELIRGYMLLHISSRMNISLLSDFFMKLMKLPMYYFDSRLTGDLIQRIGDHSRIEYFLTNTLLNGLFSLFSLVLYGALLSFYDISLFIAFMAGSIIYTCWIYFFMKKRERLDYKKFQQGAVTNSKVYELITGMQEIKLHNAEQQKRWGWERIQVKLYKINFQSLTLEQIQNMGARIINECKNIIITVVAAWLVLNGKLTLGMMLAVSYIAGQLNGPVIQISGIARAWQDARISLDRLTEIHKKEDELASFKNTSVSEIQEKDLCSDSTIQIQNLSFQYDGLSEPVLQNINLDIPAFKITAIVGASGSGKTTLMKLLMRFYEPTAGNIFVGTTPLNNIDLYSWRERCGVVMQEGFIFNDTVAGNIALGDSEPVNERIIYACKVANIHNFIEDLPLRYNTKIGQEGKGISSGQKQRILIARAIYKNPKILFLDEATSSLDARNEKEIVEQLTEFGHGRTVIVIAHRLSTVKYADKIVVLDRGKIVEEGNHDSLTAKRGYYYELVKNQLEMEA